MTIAFWLALLGGAGIGLGLVRDDGNLVVGGGILVGFALLAAVSYAWRRKR